VQFLPAKVAIAFNCLQVLMKSDASSMYLYQPIYAAHMGNLSNPVWESHKNKGMKVGQQKANHGGRFRQPKKRKEIAEQ